MWRRGGGCWGLWVPCGRAQAPPGEVGVTGGGRGRRVNPLPTTTTLSCSHRRFAWLSGFSCHLESWRLFHWLLGTLAIGLGFSQLPPVGAKG